MELIDKNNEENEIKHKTEIHQILPDYITSDILLKQALCIKAKKKDTSNILTKLKNNKLLLDKIYLKDINYHNKNYSKEYQKPNTNINSKNIESIYTEIEGNFFKRVKAYNKDENLIIISFKDDLEYKKITKEEILKNYELKEDDLIEVNIPSTESISNEQWKINNKIWPQCNYISSKEKYIYNHTSQEEKEILDIFNNNILNNKDNITCLLFDPNTKKILAFGKKEEKNIIGHDIMNLLDNYSKFLVTNNNINKHDINKEDNKEDNHYRKLGEKNPIGPKENEDLLYHIENDNENNNQYYCEGLYVFIKEEPCMMCSMALIHNRIARLYFCDTNEKEGALISKYSLDNYNLNHHYLIFQIK